MKKKESMQSLQIQVFRYKLETFNMAIKLLEMIKYFKYGFIEEILKDKIKRYYKIICFLKIKIESVCDK